MISKENEMNDQDIGGLDDQIAAAESNVEKLKAERDGLLPGWTFSDEGWPHWFRRGQFRSVVSGKEKAMAQFYDLELSSPSRRKPLDMCKAWNAEIRTHLEAMLARLGEP